jgi:signal transduction histidine kinase/CheY-like chemotaxis protein
MPRPPRITPPVLVANLILTAAYVVTGFAGLQLAIVGHVVTLFWPPSGIAFAAVWLGGLRLLPGVVLGAILINLFALPSPLLATMVGFGNALPALVSVWALRTASERYRAAGDLRSVLAFLLVAVFGASLLSAAVGAGAVAAAGLSGGDTVTSVFMVWWLGDAMGVLLVAPPILFASRWTEHRWTLSLGLEACAFLLAWAATVAAMIFVREPAWAPELFKLFTFVLSLWAGARFGLHGATTMTLLMAVGAATATAEGAGPFMRGDFYETLSLLHSYLFAQALAAILLAAALADLRRTVVAERSARDAAEAAASSQFRLVTMISHDVRTPLNGLMGVLQTLERAPLRTQEKRLVDLGLRAGGVLSALVSDLLESARVQSGRLRFVRAPFSPAESLDDLASLSRSAAAQKGLALALIGEDALPPQVVGDRLRFEQVVGNLVANAVAYTAAGEVRICADWRADAPRPLVVEVADSGPGIAPLLAARIFDAYVRGPAEEQAGNSGGLGLGLDISRRLARAMGGDLTYRPRPGGGSVFRLELPFPWGAAEPEPVSTPAPAGAGEASLAILLVDDDAIGREVTAALLESRGHRVLAVGEGAAALVALESQSFDLVLTDIQLSGGASGLDLARQIRALPGKSAGLRVLALTADAFGDHDRYRSAGIDGVLIKPLDVDVGLRSALT